MSAFQIAAMSLVGLLFLGSVFVAVRRQASRRVALPWALVWLAAGCAIAWPESTRYIARTLGIGRGADLVLYCFALVTMIGFFMVYVRIRRLESHLTTIVRQLALDERRIQTDQRPIKTETSQRASFSNETKDTAAS